MKLITPQQFLIRQPSYPEPQSTDPYFHDLCNKILKLLGETSLITLYSESALQRLSLTIIGYYQDILSDAGLWRSFINEHRRLYGKWLPFFDTDSEKENYIEYELNRADVRWLTWYALSMYYEPRRYANPLDSDIISAADTMFELLENYYDEAPVPEGYNLHLEIDLYDPADSSKIYHLAHWLFMYSYLLTPAYAMTLSEISESLNSASPDFMAEFQKKIENSMHDDPTGPLALFVSEWSHLIIENTPLKKKNDTLEKRKNEIHPLWEKFTKATGGERIKFFGDYESMNRFFIEVLGWHENEEHLPQVKGAHDYILMVDKYKGMLLARDVARNICCDINPYYDKEYAKIHAIEMLTKRGVSPCDLTRYVCSNGWLPDARFEHTTHTVLVAENYDFIARCYLQQYYRD